MVELSHMMSDNAQGYILQLQMEEEEQIRKRAANETALSAIGTRRKRPAPNSQEAQVVPI